MEKIRNFITWWNRPNKSVFADYTQSFIVIIPIAFIIRTWGYGLYKVPSGSMETTLLVGESFVSDKFSYTFLSDPIRGDIIAANEPTFKYSDNRFKRLFEEYVWGPQNWTKRVVALPGEHVQGKLDEDGHPQVFINDQKFDEPYVNKYPLIYDNVRMRSPRSYDPKISFHDQPFYRMDALQVKLAQKQLKQSGIPGIMYPGTATLGSEMSDIFDVHLKSKKNGDDKDEYWVMGDNRLGSSDSRWFGALDRKYIHGKILFRFFSVDSKTDWMIWDLLMHPLDFWTRIRWSRWMQFVK